jgi:hypothetical protein
MKRVDRSSKGHYESEAHREPHLQDCTTPSNPTSNKLPFYRVRLNETASGLCGHTEALSNVIPAEPVPARAAIHYDQ